MVSATLQTVRRKPRRERTYWATVNALSCILSMACLFSLQFLSACGGGGSGNSGGGPPPPPPNPTPSIVSLSPNSATPGEGAFTLTITGENFLPSSTVQWNGSTRVGTFSSSTQLQAQIPAADIATSGSAAVSVVNPSPGGGNSGNAEFVINATSNPAPSLASVSPSSVSAGSGTFLLTVTGSNFIPASTIQWNRSALATIYLSETQLEAEIPANNVATSGFAEIAVVNPSPGGGASAPVVFSIAYAPTVISQRANDIVWDSTNQLFYFSVPSLALSNANTVTAWNPSTGSFQTSQFAGSEPDMLAISSDNQFLYVGVDGACSVQRYTLPNLVPDISYSLGADQIFGPMFAFDLQAAPALPHTTAVSRGILNGYSALGGMAIYDDATPRSKTAHGTYDSLQWKSATTIYANNNETTLFPLYVMNVSSTGVVQGKEYQNEFSNFYVDIHYDSGTKLVYTDDGYVIDPTTGQQVGSFQAGGLMTPDSTLNRAFFLGQTAFQFGTSSFTIEEFDLTTYAPIAEIVVPNVQGYPLHLIRWQTNGLAFNDNAGYVYILSSPFVAANGVATVTPHRLLSPVIKTKSTSRMTRLLDATPWTVARSPKRRVLAHSSDSNPAPAITTIAPSTVMAGVNDFVLTVTGTNFVSLSTIEWNGSQLPTEYVSSTELQAQVSASNGASVGSVSINVVTPSPGGGTSNVLPFTIVPSSSNPAPVILSLFPDYAAAGSSGFTMNINGLAYFNPSSVVTWHGSPRSAFLYGPGQLQIQVLASDLTTPGYAQITVTNPGPGGGTSTAEFQILYQPTIVQQATNDLVWDPINQVIYISVPGSASTHANQVCVLNPSTGAIMNCQPAGGEPDVLAISDDSQFLYVGEDGTGTVQRFTLPGLVPDISYSLGGSGSPYYALDLQVAPGSPHTTAVTRGQNVSPAAQGGIMIFDDSTPRPISTPGDGYPGGGVFASIQWGSDATALYAANSETTGYDFYTLTVSSSGVVLSQDYPEVFWNPGRIHFDRGTGLVYSEDGFHAVNPSTGLPAAIFEAGGAPMVPDSTLNTAFFIARYVWQENSNYTLSFFDMTHFTPINRIPFSTTSPPGKNILIQPNRLIRWGTNGLALNDMQGNLYFLSGSFINAADHKSRSNRSKNRIGMR
jgi:hypothetical protein